MWEIMISGTEEVVLMKGNEAIAHAAIRIGVDGCFFQRSVFRGKCYYLRCAFQKRPRAAPVVRVAVGIENRLCLLYTSIHSMGHGNADRVIAVGNGPCRQPVPFRAQDNGQLFLRHQSRIINGDRIIL